jgi:hypothetical protein
VWANRETLTLFYESSAQCKPVYTLIRAVAVGLAVDVLLRVSRIVPSIGS